MPRILAKLEKAIKELRRRQLEKEKAEKLKQWKERQKTYKITPSLRDGIGNEFRDIPHKTKKRHMIPK
ncbi:MAG: hypothetical protein PF440_12090 [Thiomicrorhabdus sp.]|nr:hypothetical protein [Thiomicrorhabdus sp.]